MGPVFGIAASVYFGPLCVISLAMYCLITIVWKTMGSLSDITRFMELSKTEVNMCKIYCCHVVQCLLYFLVLSANRSVLQATRVNRRKSFIPMLTNSDHPAILLDWIACDYSYEYSY